MYELIFLKVRPGDAVLYDADQIGKVLRFIGVSLDPDASTLFQIANVDSGEIRLIHGEEVTEIVSKYRTTINKLFFTSKYNSSNNNKKNTPFEKALMPIASKGS